MSTYTKPYLSPPEQLALLKRRGLQVRDDADATAALVRNGYYRLSAYWYPFREIVGVVRTDDFLKDSFFEDARALYRFDKDLKILLMDVIERIEIATRVQIAMLLGRRDRFAYRNTTHFDRRFTRGTGRTEHQAWMERFEKAFDHSKEDFVLHHKTKYGLTAPLPIWIAIELWDFGMTSTLFRGMKGAEQNIIASNLDVSQGYILESWLRTVNHIRNIIAHHGRLWNRSIVDSPRMPNPGDMPDFDVFRPDPDSTKKLYYTCCILAHLSDAINPGSSWKKQFLDHIDNFPVMPHARIEDMGFPPGWKNHPFWT